MFRFTFVAAVVFALSTLAIAQVLTLADVKAKDAVQLSAADLKQLVPGAKVVSRTNAGSTRSWENAADGTFVASSDGRGTTGGKPIVTNGHGTWRLADDGTYCVTIQWNRQSEDGCLYIFKLGNKYYGFDKLDDSSSGSEFEFSK